MLDLSTADQSERLLGRLALLALGFGAFAIVGWPIVGSLIGEDVRDNFAYGLTIGAILTDVSLLLCLGSVPGIQKAMRAGWIALAVISLVFCIYLVNISDPEAYKTADTVLLAVMGILAFPLSLVGFVFVFLYSSLVLPDRPTSAMDLVAFWGIFTVAGYVQWFMLIPMLLRRRQLRRLKKKP